MPLHFQPNPSALPALAAAALLAAFAAAPLGAQQAGAPDPQPKFSGMLGPAEHPAEYDGIFRFIRQWTTIQPGGRDDRYDLAAIDLNGDGTDEVFARFCDWGICSALLFGKSGDGWTNILSLQRDEPVLVKTTNHDGWLDFAIGATGFHWRTDRNPTLSQYVRDN